MRIGLSRHESETGPQAVRQESPENLLLERVAKRDREALAEIYARFQRPLFIDLVGES